jgi:hypothetical protein
MKVGMSESGKRVSRHWRRRWAFAVSTVVLLVCSIPAAQPSNVPTQLQLARGILEAAFPELMENEAHTNIVLRGPFNRDWLISREVFVQVLQLEGGDPYVDTGNPGLDQYLGATFRFDRDVLSLASFSGRRVKSREMTAIAEEARVHSDWTDAELEAAIVRAGGRFGPNKKLEFSDTINIQRYSSALGRIQRSESTFRWRFGNADLGADDIFTPTWAVSVDAMKPAGQRRCYGLFFEPLSAALTQVTARKCQ